MQEFQPFYAPGRTRFRVFLRVILALVLLTALYHPKHVFRNPSKNFNGSIHPGNPALTVGVFRRSAVEQFDQSQSNNTANRITIASVGSQSCSELSNHKGSRAKCDFLIAHPWCDSDGFFSYLRFFYCACGHYSFFGYIVLIAALIILFYLLGNTAADYFCCSLEKLSDLLKLSPTLAGVSLLPFGNGAPDVFSSIAAFLGSGSGGMGVSTVLGGAVFIVSIVVGVVSLCVAKKRVQIDRKCFVRDVCFFLFAIICLGFILLVGKVTTGVAIAFLSIYILYGFSVALSEIMKRKGEALGFNCGSVNPLLPVASGFFPHTSEEDESLRASLLKPSGDGEDSPYLVRKLPHWIWTSNVIIYSDYMKPSVEESTQPLWGWTDENQPSNIESSFSCSWLWSLVEIPLTIPRRLTIPVVEEERWSKPYAVASALLAPILLAFLWNNSQESTSSVVVYIIGAAFGCVFGTLAMLYTKADHPPHKLLLPWVLGGFFMSILWFYMIANELVALLVAFGTILSINPSLLAITILAWGNSMGDLVSNTALAMNKQNGVQIAMSGCYAGPMFNTVVGLGLSMILGAWSEGSAGYIFQRDTSLFYTIGFLMAALIWALVVLLNSEMRPNRILGVGLITIYVMFLCFRIGTAMGTASPTGHTD